MPQLNPALVDSYRYLRAHGRGATATVAIRVARSDMAKGVRRYPSPIYPATCAQSDAGAFYVIDPAKAGLRYVGRAETESRYGEVWAKRNDSGWYTSPYQEVFRDGTGLMHGVVYQLPARKGVARFVAGYADGCNPDSPVLYLDSIFEAPARGEYSATDLDAARDAARMANEHARVAAEHEREYQTAWQAGSRFSELGEDIRNARGEARRLLAERRKVKSLAGAAGAYEAICGAIRHKVADCLERIGKAREQRGMLREGDYSPLYFWNGEKRLREAFNEGAGVTVL